MGDFVVVYRGYDEPIIEPTDNSQNKNHIKQFLK